MNERDATRDRFLTAIAEKINRDAIAEVHLFQAIKQGGTESGVAVIAVEELMTGLEPRAQSPEPRAQSPEPRAQSPEPRAQGPEPRAQSPELRAQSPEPRAQSLVVYTARYRLTLKGPDRGKWEFAIQAEADAPLVTIDKVVQGVQRRSGDAEGPERMTGDEFRARLPATSTTP